MEEETGEVELRVQAAQGRQEVGLEHSELEEAEEQHFDALLPPDRQTHHPQQNQTSWVCQETVLQKDQ